MVVARGGNAAAYGDVSGRNPMSLRHLTTLFGSWSCRVSAPYLARRRKHTLFVPSTNPSRTCTFHRPSYNMHSKNPTNEEKTLFTMTTPGSTKSAQGSRVAMELEVLRQKQLAKNQRQKLKDIGSPLTTPEEAQAFLAAMRNKSHERDIMHKPPSNLSGDGLDSWYMQQRKREKELRERRKEAEALLRGYRGYGGLMSPPSQMFSENLDDPAGMHAADYALNTPRLHSDDARGDDGNRLPPAQFEKSPASAQAYETLEEKNDTKDAFKAMHEEHDTEANDANVGRSMLRQPSPISIPAVDQSVPETVWRDFISSAPGAKFPPDAGRYRLYLSYACPGSHRALIVRALKGLEDIVPVTYLHPTWRLTNPADPEDKHRGWVFGDPFGEEFANTIGRGGPFPPAFENTFPDPEFNAYSIRQMYESAGDNSGKYTIPLLWDTKQKTIVNNESSDIAYMLNSCFNQLAKNSELDLYTEDDSEGQAKLNAVSEWLSPLMIHGVYRCGFAKNQIAYDNAIAELCEAYDRADDILQVQRYLTGDTLTDADIRLFVTLIRFDEVYAFYFKANARLVMLTPSLLNFCRDIYQMPGVAETCDMDQIKAHFYGSHAEWNKYSVIPRGLGFMELLDMPHDREDLVSNATPSFGGEGAEGGVDEAAVGLDATNDSLLNSTQNSYDDNL